MLRNRNSTTSEKSRLLHDTSTQCSLHASRSSYGSISISNWALPRKLPRFLCTKRDTVIVAVAFLILIIILTISLTLGLPALEAKERLYYNPPPYVSSSPLVQFPNATVISDGQLCAQIGKEMLLKGGHVVDAAIATSFCTGVVNPESAGLGGGFIMIVYEKKTGKAEVIDARETAPEAATVDMFSGNSSLSQRGGLAIAVPGQVKGFYEAHKKYGVLKWEELIEPTIKICREGFNVSKHMADKLVLIKNHLGNYEHMRDLFTNNDTNELYKENELFKNPQLAETLKIIANDSDAFYRGTLMETLVEDVKKCGGIITETDFKNYTTRVQDPIQVTLLNQGKKTLYSVPPPGSGAVLSLIMLILDGYNISTKMLENLNDRVLIHHRFIEALKFGYSYRSLLSDDLEDAGLSEVIKNLASREFADKIRAKIKDDSTQSQEYYSLKAKEVKEDHGTSHVSVLGANGDAVSVTSTINTYFGSLCVSPSTGIIFNNEMDDFSSPNITSYFEVPPSEANQIKPGRRPLSSLTPAIVTDKEGDVTFVSGAVGGTRIISTTAQALLRILWLNEDVKLATDAARIHHQLFPNEIFYEKEFPRVYRDRLQKKGHKFSPEIHPSQFLGILKENQIETNSDYRRGGSVAGY